MKTKHLNISNYGGREEAISGSIKIPIVCSNHVANFALSQHTNHLIKQSFMRRGFLFRTSWLKALLTLSRF
jgi:hypothetical protein